MKKPVESIRLSKTDKEALIRIKRKTGIESWNVLCRWALLLALADEESRYRVSQEKRDAVEIRWETFVGELKELITGLLLLSHSRSNSKKVCPSLGEYLHFKLSDGIKRLAKAVESDAIAICPDKILEKTRGLI
jgi:DNA sulfur modification protein DndE